MRPPSVALLGACFFLSGFSALVYQAAWANYLGLVFGTSQLAVATVLAAYMFGLAVGAYAASRVVDRIRRPVLVYGSLEGIIALSALLVPFFIGASQDLYVLLFGAQERPGVAQGLAQPSYFLMVTFVVLLVPTTAMGATLPLLAKYLVVSRRGIGSGVGLLYGINTGGAVAGVLCSGFILLPFLGLAKTVYCAVAMNALIFALIVWRARDLHLDPTESTEPAVAPRFHWMYPLALATGVISFTLEVFWTRLLSHVMGGTSYAFAVMLGCFLTGIALGGYAGGRLAGDRSQAARSFYWAQLLMVSATLGTYLWVCVWQPASNLSPAARGLLAFAALFPATFFLGSTFPLAVRTVTSSRAEAASCTGRVYAWNTFGAIIGSILAGFFLLPSLGFSGAMRFVLLGGLGIALGTAFLAGDRSGYRRALPMAIALVVVLLIPLPRPSSLLTAHVQSEDEVEEVFYAVGRSSTVLLHRENGFYKLASNGLSESAIGSRGMPPFQLSQKWLSALPSLARPDARDMLIIGLGGGIALQGVPPHMQTVDTIELEPRVLAANQAVAARRTTDPLRDPRVTVILNDARNALLLTDKRYDIVVSQPSHPWTGGASHLYTQEFLSLAKARMHEDGVFLQWINSQFIDGPLLEVMAATLKSRFSHVELYQPERQVLMFLASDAPLGLWDGPQRARVAIQRHREHYQHLGMRALEDALAMLTFDKAGVDILASKASPNTDDENLLAYRARPRTDGLTADSLLQAFPDLDPLTRPGSAIHKAQGSLSFPYLAERLLQSNFIQRVHGFARATEDPVTAGVIDALGLEYTGEVEGAERLLRSALASNSEHREAALVYLRLHLDDFAARSLSPEVARLANRLQGPSRAALEGWVFGAGGDFPRLRGLDGRLAAIDPRSPLYPVAVKLRVDWRLWASITEGDAGLAQRGLALLDGLLASYWNADLYLLRAACASAAQRPHAMIESYAAAISQLQNEVKSAPRSVDVIAAERLRRAVARFEASVEGLRDDEVLRRVGEIRQTL